MSDTSAQKPAGSLRVNGPISPPLTPAFHGNAIGIIDGQTDLRNLQASLRPVSPDPSTFSSPESACSANSSPAPRPASTFTGTSFSDSQPAGLGRKDSATAPGYGVHEQDSPPSSRARAKMRSYTDGRSERAFPRLSKPVELLRSSYDVVVIGSGYGGGVAASRMARTGQSVCVLERGREKWPGEYPTGSLEAMKEVHCSGTLARGLLPGKLVEGGDPTGMFHMIFGRGQSAVVCNGWLIPNPPQRLSSSDARFFD